MDGPFARRISLALDVGRILQERQHPFFAVFGKTVQIEQSIISRRWINLEISRVQYDAERRMDSQRDAIDKTMRDLQRMDGKRPDLEPFSGANLAQVGVVEQLML